MESKAYPHWLQKCRNEIVEPRKRVIENHPFVRAMLGGFAEPRHAEPFFSGLMWHLLDFGKHVAFHMNKRPPEVAKFLEGRSEDKDGDTDILRRIVEALAGPADLISITPWSYRPHPVWITHDALLRSAVYSADFPWQVATAALNVGIESLVPTMIEPLFAAATKHYGLNENQAAWLESRSGEEEKQHGENGWLILSNFVSPDDLALQKLCVFYIDALSQSMAYGLLQSGLRPNFTL